RCFPYPGDGGRFLRGAFLRTYVSSHDHPGQGESTHHQAAVQGGGAAARALSHHSTNSTRVITKSVRGVRGSAKCLSTASLRSDGPSSQFGDALSDLSGVGLRHRRSTAGSTQFVVDDSVRLTGALVAGPGQNAQLPAPSRQHMRGAFGLLLLFVGRVLA